MLNFEDLQEYIPPVPDPTPTPPKVGDVIPEIGRDIGGYVIKRLKLVAFDELESKIKGDPDVCRNLSFTPHGFFDALWIAEVEQQ